MSDAVRKQLCAALVSAYMDSVTMSEEARKIRRDISRAVPPGIYRDAYANKYCVYGVQWVGTSGAKDGEFKVSVCALENGTCLCEWKLVSLLGASGFLEQFSFVEEYAPAYPKTNVAA